MNLGEILFSPEQLYMGVHKIKNSEQRRAWCLGHCRQGGKCGKHSMCRSAVREHYSIFLVIYLGPRGMLYSERGKEI